MINEPIGLIEAKTAIKKIVENAEAYRKGGLKPPDLILDIRNGNGRSCFAEYVRDTYKSYQITHFPELDDLLEYRVNGNLNALQKIFAEIDSAAVYSNQYEGIIAFGIDGLVKCVDEYQTQIFCDKVKELKDSASLLFYLNSFKETNERALIKKLQEIDDIEQIHISGYTQEELVEILIKDLDLAGVAINDKGLNDKLVELIERKGFSTVKDIETVKKALIKGAYNTRHTPDIYRAILDDFYKEGDRKR